MSHVPRTRILGTLLLGLALTLTACGSDGGGDGGSDEPTTDTTTEVSETEHNDADVTFASEMIQHHAQALSMVDLTVQRTLDPEVQEIAEDVRGAQGPEIETMSDWLQEWGEEVPETMRDHSNAGQDMAGMGDSMPGMMSDADFDELESASDEDFETLWLEMMIAHHEGAVEMARAEQEDGRFASAVDLAGAVVDSQSVEIEEMRTLLGS